MIDQHLSHLADRLVVHLIAGRTEKALKIAQYLRAAHGYHLVSNLDITTGQSRVEGVSPWTR